MDIHTILEENPGITISLSYEDLKKFAKELIASSQEIEKKEKLYTMRELCDVFGITMPTVHRWTKYKVINSVKLGHRRYYPESEIQRVLTLKND